MVDGWHADGGTHDLGTERGDYAGSQVAVWKAEVLQHPVGLTAMKAGVKSDESKNVGCVVVAD